MNEIEDIDEFTQVELDYEFPNRILKRKLKDACDEDDVNRVKKLLEHGVGGIEDIFMEGVQDDKLEIVKLFLENDDFLINYSDDDGFTALIHASKFNSKKVVSYLLACSSANVNDKVNDNIEDGYTALMFACSRGNRWIAKELIKHGADVFIKNKIGETAYDLFDDSHHAGFDYDNYEDEDDKLCNLFQTAMTNKNHDKKDSDDTNGKQYD